MKNKKHTLCLFNLIFFLGSFVLMSMVSFSNSANNQDPFHLEHKISTSKNHGDSNSSQIITEENENETESDFELQAFLVPFFISFCQISSINEHCSSEFPLTEKLTNPIYLSVCNFRI